MKKRYLILIMYTAMHITNTVTGQTSNTISVPVYDICNKDLSVVLDSFILNEMKYDYYDKNTVFYANTMNVDGTILQISSGSDFLKIPLIDKFYVDSTLGVFYFKTHIFLLYGRSIVCNKLMKKSIDKQIVCVRDTNENNSLLRKEETFAPTTWFCKFDGFNVFITNKIDMHK